MTNRNEKENFVKDTVNERLKEIRKLPVAHQENLLGGPSYNLLNKQNNDIEKKTLFSKHTKINCENNNENNKHSETKNQMKYNNVETIDITEKENEVINWLTEQKKATKNAKKQKELNEERMKEEESWSST
jgi:hypothetical protein